ncbi:MAG: methyltransferase domain-containing protein [Bacilli bacterium]
MLKCPNCHALLVKNEKSFLCSNNHNFDIARSGYVNLLLAHEANKQPGDNIQMVHSRLHFMKAGFYDPLGMLIKAILASFVSSNQVILDCGCGPGFFTNILKQAFHDCDIYGLDVSKKAIDVAAKTYKDILFVVGSAAYLPFFDESVDVLVNIFAPHFESEFHRVLKKTGLLVKVVPNTNHLKQLKVLLYDNPLFYTPKKLEQSCWHIFSEIPLTYDVNIKHEQLVNLLQMTPYWYTTHPEDLEKINQITDMVLTMDFLIYVIKRSSS